MKGRGARREGGNEREEEREKERRVSVLGIRLGKPKHLPVLV